NKPVINYILDKLKETTIEKVYVITNNKFYQNFLDWKNTLNYNLNIEILNDNTNSNEDKLGAIGDINFVISKLNLQEPLLIIGGDNLFDFNLNEVITYFNENKKDLTVLFEETDIEKLKQLCSIKLDNSNKITYFEEKPLQPSSTWFSVCIYLYTLETIASIKNYILEGNNPDQPGRFLQWLYPKKEVHGFKSFGKWFDIGTLEQLENARKEFKF
ncbi:MAG: hypothetical protein KKG75_01365, partial [Nanoarchaeota archaeon]|nr:hypothetical protein [Nanoarchaeota archaeon]